MIALYPKSLHEVLARLIALCALATILGFFGSHHWILALFANIPLQLTGTLLLLGALCLITKRKHLITLCLVVLLPNLWQISYYYWPRFHADEAADLRLVCFNVLKSNPNHGAVLAHLESTDADLIALIEVNEEWLRDLSPLEKSHPHFAHLPNNHNFGLALYSKYPVISYKRPMPTRGHPLIIAEINYKGSLLNVVVAHPVPPMSKLGAEYWDRYLQNSVAKVAELKGPVLFMGDLNATPWSHRFPIIAEKTGLQDSGHGRGFQSTWKRHNPFFSTPIDHVFHSTELRPTARSIGPANGSDHSPIIVDFAFSPTLSVPEPTPKAPAPPPTPTAEPPAPPRPSGTVPRVRRVPDKEPTPQDDP